MITGEKKPPLVFADDHRGSKRPTVVMQDPYEPGNWDGRYENNEITFEIMSLTTAVQRHNVPFVEVNKIYA